MTKKMLIDATHDEETRVAVVDGNRLVEFDYESKIRKALKGSIFLAKVTRVEPSLQAAFVNFGGNRHGFLPFSEIHPDYFRIPIADREALLAEQEAAMAEDEDDEDEQQQDSAAGDAPPADEAEGPVTVEDEGKDMVEEVGGGKAPAPKTAAAPGDAETEADEDDEAADHDDDHHHGHEHGHHHDHDDDNNTDHDEPSPGNEREPDVDLGSELTDQETEEDTIGNRAEGASDGGPGHEQDGPGDHQGRRRRGGRNRRGGRGRHQRGGGGAQHRSRRTEKYDDEQQSSGDRFRFSLRRKYKIQEVIKRGQIMLVQVSKEERGNKGAAVSTYLSLPGRYCVLMPNSPRGGGVSRKISNYQERAKMREIMKDLEVPKGMSVIVRTAGVSRTKAEVKRDLDYLMRLWDNIRELTLQSTAPALVYEEANLIKRAVRDLYSRDVEDIHVSGEEGFKQARDFMKMIMPSHVKKVHQYKDDMPLFTKYKVESQIADIGEPRVNLPSGGYLIFNPTEALVAIDVNSGKATKERHIEETATRTNMEAAEEVARQLRMRDLGGLIVIDFIDMEDRRNNAKVERKMRESLSGDRARIQMGRISSFGLMELSRQRLNPSLTESQYETCARCAGLGRVRTADASSVMVMRAVEDEGMKGRAEQVIVHVPHQVATYILNNKRKYLSEMEARYKFTVLIRVDETVGVSGFRVEVSRPAPQGGGSEDESESRAEDDTGRSSRAPDDGQGNREGRDGRGGRRRGRRGGRRRRGRGGEGQPRGEQGEGPAQGAGGQSFADAIDGDGGGYDDAPADHAGPDASYDDAAFEHAAEPAPPPSNDDQPRKAAAPPSQPQAQAQKKAAEAPRDKQPREYEKINEAPGEKKKGWWNRLSGE